MKLKAGEIPLIGKFVFLPLSGVGVCKEDEVNYRKMQKPPFLCTFEYVKYICITLHVYPFKLKS